MATDTLRFANYLAFNINPAYAAISAEIGRQLNIPTSFEEGQSFQQLFDGEIGVGFICGLPYSQISRRENCPFELLVAPVMVGERYEGKPVYFSDVVVHADSSFETFDGLAGCRFTFNEEVSYSGYHVVEHYLGERGLDWSFFGEVKKSGAHLNSIAAVANKQADAAAIDCHALLVEMKTNPSLRQELRIVTSLGPSTIPPVVVKSELPESVKAALREQFLNIHNSSAQAEMAACGIEKFVAVDDAYYNFMRDRITTQLYF